MSKIKKFKSFNGLDKKLISEICSHLGLSGHRINDDGSVDVDGDVRLSHNPPRFQGNIPIKFGKVSGSFYCFNSNLKNLKNCPDWVGEDFWVSNNQLTSLVGMPKYIGDGIDLSYNKLTNFEGFPEYFSGVLNIHNNPVYEIFMLFWVPKAIDIINELDVIQGNKIVFERLEEVYHRMDKKMPKEFYFENYELV